MGFSALMLDRYGYHRRGVEQLHDLRALLGTPIARRGDRLVAWDLRATRALPAGLSSWDDFRSASKPPSGSTRIHWSQAARSLRQQNRQTCR